MLKKAGLSSKEVALFGCGDSESYCDTFCDGIGVLYEELKGTGCKFIGNHVPTGDYNFSSSTAVVDGEFAGLPLDEMNESDKTVLKAVEILEKGESFPSGSGSSGNKRQQEMILHG